MLKTKPIIIFIIGAVFYLPSMLIAVGEVGGSTEFIYDVQGKRNPFIPLVGRDGRMISLEKDEKKSGVLLVEGIIYDKNGRSYAIVNSQVVEIGDKVLEYQVLKIEGDKVLFIKDGLITQVELKKEEE